ncbi:MAG: FmdB family zinc ribbon protein [Patescibacteria group bacterium]
MPIYNFQCIECEHEFSGIFPMRSSGGEEVSCPECGNGDVKRVYKSGATLISNSDSRTEDSNCPTCPVCSGGACDF